ncbi:unnamed protein product, partial [Mesorhabditis spiculigera]
MLTSSNPAEGRYKMAFGAQFPTAQQTDIVAQHNSFRSTLAKGQYKAKSGAVFAAATNMQRMIWNSSLAAASSAYADTCPGLVHSRAEGVGENLYIIWGGKLDGLGKQASNSWADEFSQYGPMNYEFTYQTGHATQMAWADTATVGCGYAFCQRDKSYFVVCRYFKQGNWMGEKAYDQGTTCSKCPSKSSCNNTDGLCG